MEKALPMKKEKVKRKIHWKRFLPVYLLALPGVIYLIINNYLPMFGVVIAFKDLDFRKGILFSDWAGLQNFQYLFQSSDVWQITRNTVCYRRCLATAWFCREESPCGFGAGQMETKSGCLYRDTACWLR